MFGRTRRSPSRLGHWNGRRTSSRAEPRVLGSLRHGPVLGRLGVALMTVVVVTTMAALSGPSVPYRLGEIVPRDVRVRTGFEVVDLPQTDWVREEEGPRREPVIDKYHPGRPLVKAGRPISEAQLALLHDENRAHLRGLGPSDRIRRAAGLFLVHLLLAVVVVLYVGRFQPALAESLPGVIGVCVLVVATLAVGLLLSRAPWHALLVPMTVTAMILAVAYTPPFALLLSLCLSLSATLALDRDVGHLLILMTALATAVLLLKTLRTRTRLVEVAAGAGVACALMTVAIGLLTSQTTRFTGYDAGRHFVWCVLGGFILSGSLPLVERAFGIVTDVSLLELADSGHPLLEELVRRAPGTYTHSMTVATLAEAAAEAVGGNPLLARVGGYFHDVGKVLKPHYFVENQSGHNLHDGLEPTLSTLVIIGHVKDGMALAEQYKLPRPITDFIVQHHGTTLVEYFYREAMRLGNESGHPCRDLEPGFRYPGPKPQSRETAILMLADAVESASRALPGPTAGSLRKLVHDLMMKRLLDGQFEESGLTLSELRVVEESLAKGIAAVYHSRIAYPEAPAAGKAS